jgi:hypothetical protein
MPSNLVRDTTLRLLESPLTDPDQTEVETIAESCAFLAARLAATPVHLHAHFNCGADAAEAELNKRRST